MGAGDVQQGLWSVAFAKKLHVPCSRERGIGGGSLACGAVLRCLSASALVLACHGHGHDIWHCQGLARGPVPALRCCTEACADACSSVVAGVVQTRSLAVPPPYCWMMRRRRGTRTTTRNPWLAPSHWLQRNEVMSRQKSDSHPPEDAGRFSTVPSTSPIKHNHSYDIIFLLHLLFVRACRRCLLRSYISGRP